MATLSVTLTANDQLTSKLRSISSEINKLKGGLNGLNSSSDKVSNSIGKIGNTAKSSLSGVGSAAENSGNAISKLTSGIGEMVSHYGGIMMIRNAFEWVSNSISSAVQRLDTFTTFQRKMTLITGSSDNATNAMNAMNEAVMDTAYNLDTATTAVQQFVAAGGMETEAATQSVKNWMDIVSAYGKGTNAELQSVIDAITKMRTKGKVNMLQLNTLMWNGIPAVQAYAKSVGRSTEDVQEDLSKGKIRANEFLDVVEKAFINGTNGINSVAGQAKVAGNTWAAALEKVGAAGARGVGDIIDKFDKAVESGTGGINFKNTLVNLAKTAEQVFKQIGSLIERYVPPIVEKIKPFLEAINSNEGREGMAKKVINLVKGLIALKGAMIGLSSIKSLGYSLGLIGNNAGIAYDVLSKFKGLFNIFVNAGSAVASITGIAYALGSLNQNGELSGKITGVFDKLIEKVTTVGENLPNKIRAFTDSLLELDESGVSKLQRITNGFIEVIRSVSSGFTRLIPELAKAGKEIFLALVDSVKRITPTVVDTFTNVIDQSIKGFKEKINNLGGQEKLFTQFFKNIRNAITSFAGGIRKGIVGISEWLSTPLEDGTPRLQKIVNTVLNLFFSFANGIVDSIPTIERAIKTIARGILKGFENLLPSLRGIFVNIAQQLPRLILNLGNKLAYSFTDIGNSLSRNIIDFSNYIITPDENGNTPIQKFTQYAVQIAKALGQGLATALPSLIKAGAQIVKALWEGIKQAGPQLLEAGKEMISSFFTGIDQKSSGITGTITKIVGAFAVFSLLKGPIKTVTGLFTGLFTTIRNFGAIVVGVLSSALGVFRTVFGGIKSVVGGISNVFEFLGGIVFNLGKKLYGFWGPIKTGFVGLGSAISNVYHTIVGAGSGLLSTINIFGTAIPTVESFTLSFTGVGTALAGVYSSFKVLRVTLLKVIATFAGLTGVVGIIAMVTGAIVGALGILNWNGQLGVQIQNFFAKIPETIEKTGNWIKQKIDAITNYLNTPLEDGTMPIEHAVQMGANLIGAIVSGIWNAIPSLASAIWGVVTSIGNLVMTAGPQLISSGFSAIQYFIQGIGQGLKDLLNWIVTGLTNIFTYFNDHAEEIKQTGRDLINNICSGVAETIGTLISTIGSVISGWGQTLQERGPELVAQGVTFVWNLITGIASAIPDLLKGAVQIVGALVFGIISHIGDVVGAIGKLILAVIQGFIDGIANIIDIVIPGAGDIIKNFTDGLFNGIFWAWDKICGALNWLGGKFRDFFSTIAQWFGVDTSSWYASDTDALEEQAQALQDVTGATGDMENQAVNSYDDFLSQMNNMQNIDASQMPDLSAEMQEKFGLDPSIMASWSDMSQTSQEAQKHIDQIAEIQEAYNKIPKPEKPQTTGNEELDQTNLQKYAEDMANYMEVTQRVNKEIEVQKRLAQSANSIQPITGPDLTQWQSTIGDNQALLQQLQAQQNYQLAPYTDWQPVYDEAMQNINSLGNNTGYPIQPTTDWTTYQNQAYGSIDNTYQGINDRTTTLSDGIQTSLTGSYTNSWNNATVGSTNFYNQQNNMNQAYAQSVLDRSTDLMEALNHLFVNGFIGVFDSIQNIAFSTIDNIEARFNEMVNSLNSVDALKETSNKNLGEKKVLKLSDTDKDSLLKLGTLLGMAGVSDGSVDKDKFVNYMEDLNDKLNSYKVGTRYVPEDMIAQIHKGEAIIPAKYNPYNKSNRIDSLVNADTSNSVSPQANTVINPEVTPSINPYVNTVISPDVTASINPNISPVVAPNISNNINPYINPSINPNINPSVNPIINTPAIPDMPTVEMPEMDNPTANLTETLETLGNGLSKDNDFMITGTDLSSYDTDLGGLTTQNENGAYTLNVPTTQPSETTSNYNEDNSSYNITINPTFNSDTDANAWVNNLESELHKIFKNGRQRTGGR